MRARSDCQRAVVAKFDRVAASSVQSAGTGRSGLDDRPARQGYGCTIREADCIGVPNHDLRIGEEIQDGSRRRGGASADSAGKRVRRSRIAGRGQPGRCAIGERRSGEPSSDQGEEKRRCQESR